MVEDTGLWFVNGKVRSFQHKERVWRLWNAAWDRFLAKQRRMETRHLREQEKYNRKQARLYARRPFTPWVGHVDKGAVEAFVKSARVTATRRGKERV